LQKVKKQYTVARKKNNNQKAASVNQIDILDLFSIDNQIKKETSWLPFEKALILRKKI
jgi:hypothetical protein